LILQVRLSFCSFPLGHVFDQQSPFQVRSQYCIIS
jgi:peptide methionine sulfoxide reductase MsrB